MKLFNYEKALNASELNLCDEYLLEQYKNVATIIENTTHRRININAFFVGILTTFLAFIGIGGTTWDVRPEIIVTLSMFAFILTLIWQCSVRTYMLHNLVFYYIMQQMESRMAVQYYRYEWSKVGRFDSLVSISKKEIALTFIFGLMFLILPTVYLASLGWEFCLYVAIVMFDIVLIALTNLWISVQYSRGKEHFQREFENDIRELDSVSSK